MTSTTVPSSRKREGGAAVNKDDDRMIVTPLGAGNEVGRSCVHMTYKGKTVLFDCAIHPGFTGMAALPYFDEIDPSTIDVLLVTHFHLDHAASLPYFFEKTTFKGRVFMTHATKVIYRLLLTDYIKVSKVSVEDMLYTEKDVENSMKKIEVMFLVLPCLWWTLLVSEFYILEIIHGKRIGIFELLRPPSSLQMCASLSQPMEFNFISRGTFERNALLMSFTTLFLKVVVS